ncbi:hypothetical protein [Halosegnis marinus]|uniref:Uncharacterized protein n=1 Tax=Halosegnis marinus TaxID=3034023 RepID=A0ABD5ZQD9_9EURY|nr:hypothetical protein [Halosegnis sp. DT85]
MERWPTVPERALDDGGWERADRSTETVFDLGVASVVGRTLLYEDPALRERLGTGETTRFFFATALDFRPTLPPGAEGVIESTVANEAADSFAADLRDRGFAGLRRRRQGTLRVDSGARARLSNVRATCEVGGEQLDVTGWLAVWRDDGFLLAGGAYPEVGEEEYREELLSLIRAVE